MNDDILDVRTFGNHEGQKFIEIKSFNKHLHREESLMLNKSHISSILFKGPMLKIVSDSKDYIYSLSNDGVAKLYYEKITDKIKNSYS